MKSLFLIITFAVVMLFAHSYVPAQSKSTQSEKGTQKEAEQKEKAKSTDDMPPPPPGETGQEPSKEKSADKIVGKTPDGKNVYQGPKGGMYTINAKGDKAYLDADQKQKVVPLMKEGDKIVGKTEDGKPIYEGPKGGRYTLNAKGEKVYLKK